MYDLKFKFNRAHDLGFLFCFVSGVLACWLGLVLNPTILIRKEFNVGRGQFAVPTGHRQARGVTAEPRVRAGGVAWMETSSQAWSA